MKRNVGVVDRGIRLTVGMVLIIGGIALNSWWGAVGIVLLATAIIDWCPLYAIFGISTCKHERHAA